MPAPVSNERPRQKRRLTRQKPKRRNRIQQKPRGASELAALKPIYEIV